MKCAVQRQLSVAIENQPGRLAAISRLMAGRGINIKDLSVVDNVEQGMIRLIPSDAVLCKSLLVSQGLNVVEADVLELILNDTPGKLALVSQVLADAQVNIDYAYGSEDATQDRFRLILKVSNIPKAVEALQRLPEN